MEVFLPAGGFLEAMNIREVGQAALQLTHYPPASASEITGMQYYTWLSVGNLAWLKKGESSNIKHRVRQDQMCDFERPSPGCTGNIEGQREILPSAWVRSRLGGKAGQRPGGG